MHENDPNYNSIPNNLMITSYMAEIEQFSKISKLPEFQTILGYLNNYQKYLRKQIKSRNPLPPILDASNNTRILNIKDLNKAMRIKFDAAHIAACCILLKKEAYINEMLNSYDIQSFAMKYITSIAASESKKSTDIMQRINVMDSVRIMQLLRILGLIRRPSSKTHQLGLGAAAGIKDIHFVHSLPKITSSHSSGSNIKKHDFDYIYTPAANVVLLESDPRFKDTYNQYANNPNMSVEGYIGDTMELLRELPSKNLAKFNLVTMLRVEPAMIPDTAEFFRNLYPVIDNSCDLVFSIGSGDNLETYHSRIDLTAQLFSDLNQAGLSPILIRLHHGGTLMEQGTSLQYGSAIASSFEILYCNLDPKKLQKTFG